MFIAKKLILVNRYTQSAKTRPGADCGSDHELLIAKFRLKLKKVGKTTRPFRYDLNQIPYNYTVEVRNRFKGLDLIDRVPDELWMEVRDIVQETGIKTIPMEKKCKKSSVILSTVNFQFHSWLGSISLRPVLGTMQDAAPYVMATVWSSRS